MNETKRILLHTQTIKNQLFYLEQKVADPHEVLRICFEIRQELARIVNAPQVKAGADLSEP